MGLSKISGSGIDDNVIVPANLHSSFVLPISKLATDGGATFGGSVNLTLIRVVGNGTTYPRIIGTPDGTFYSESSAGNYPWQLNPNGSAKFNHYVWSNRTTGTDSAFYATHNGAEKVNIRANGSASFASGGFALNANGEISTNVKSAGHIELDSTGSFSSPKIKLFANSGNATFAGVGTFSGDLRVQDGGNFRVRNANNPTQDAILLQNNGSITAASGATFGGRVDVGGLTVDSNLTPTSGTSVEHFYGTSGGVIQAFDRDNNNLEPLRVRGSTWDLALDGSATFSNSVYIGGNSSDLVASSKNVSYMGAGPIVSNRASSSNTAISVRLNGVDKTLLKSDGSATLRGNLVNGSATDYVGTYLGTSTGTDLYGVKSNAEKWRIKGDGSATFAGDIIVGNGGFASQDKTGLYLAATAGFCNVYHSASTSGNFLSFTKYNASASGNFTTQARITDSGAATFAADASINGLTVGKGAGNISTNTTAGGYAMNNNTSGSGNTGIGYYVLYSNTSGTLNTGLGYQALYFNTTGAENTAIGVNSLVFNTTGGQNTATGQRTLYNNTTGSYNTASGKDALFYNTSGGYNTATGYQSLLGNTTGEDHVAGGYKSLYSNTTGQSNTAIGRTALYSNTTGSSNVAMGRDALFSNTTGSYNTAIGRVAMTACTTGGSNTAVGFQALRTNTTGSTNSAFGQDALRANATGSNNVAVGFRAMDENTTGGENTAVGYRALEENTTGANNVAVGFEALQKNTTGNNNTALGLYTLLQNTTGYENCAVGRSALQNNTTAYYNLAIGNQALFTNTTGNQNTAVGYKAMRSNNNGNYNTAVGYQVLHNSSAGDRITAIGYQAGYSNTDGGYSTSIGMYAAYHNTTGQGNSSLGYYSLYYNTTGNYNTAIGYQSLHYITTGSYNTAIGHNSGLNNTTGSGNTFLGYNVNATAATTSHSIVIGKDIVGVGGGGYVTIGMNNTSDKIYNHFQANATWTRNSDVRLKKDIVTNTDCGLDFINDLRTVTYKWRAPSELDQTMSEYDPNKTEASYEGTMHGFIAQEVKQALDDNNITDFAGWTNSGGEDDLQGVSYEMFVMPLVKSVQELATMIKELQTEIAALKGA